MVGGRCSGFYRGRPQRVVAVMTGANRSSPCGSVRRRPSCAIASPCGDGGGHARTDGRADGDRLMMTCELKEPVVPVEMGMWRIDQGPPKKLEPTKMPTEAELEHLLEQDPTILGDPLLVIGRQVHTPYNKIIDLLAIDVDGNLHVLELKRDMTPRDVVAQALDYGSWVRGLQRADVLEIAEDHFGEQPFTAAFEDAFGQPLPDEVNMATGPARSPPPPSARDWPAPPVRVGARRSERAAW